MSVERIRGEHDITVVPDRTEAAAYYLTYIDQIPEGDICGLLDAQGKETRDLLLMEAIYQSVGGLDAQVMVRRQRLISDGQAKLEAVSSEYYFASPLKRWGFGGDLR
ncbi:MAG TPA: hypothetical protein VJ810_27010 [Blastocatellia bacterium]|nr:hypothetical protein [Blastocatellia bacterium]